MALPDIEAFAEALQSIATGVSVHYREASPGKALRWIDIRMGSRFSAVSWQQNLGFGFYDEDDPGYGREVPVLLVRDPSAAADHELEVLRAQGWPLGGRPLVAGMGRSA